MTTETLVSQVNLLTSDPASGGGVERLPASPQSVERFEQLMFEPQAAHAVASPDSLATDAASLIDKLRTHAEALSTSTASNDELVKRVLTKNPEEISTAELTLVNAHLTSGVVNVEVTAKVAGSLDNGIRAVMNHQ